MAETHLGYDGYWQQPMRNSLPAMIHVQTNFPSLAGHVGVGVEGSNATIGGDDKYHSNSGNTLAVPPLDPYGPSARYFDVFTRGTKECEWEAVPWQPWVKVSPSKGTVGAKGSDTRVLVSIDWANAPPAPYASTININVTTPCRGIDRYSFKAPMVQVPVVNRVVPSSFSTGFVESDGVVAITGAHYQAIKAPAQSGGANVSYHTFANYGRTGSGVGLVPQGAEKLSVDTAPALDARVQRVPLYQPLGGQRVAVPVTGAQLFRRGCAGRVRHRALPGGRGAAEADGGAPRGTDGGRKHA